MKHYSGFTLLELMVTVSVAAILLAVGIPGFQEFVRNNRRATEINNLISTLHVARSEAVARNQRIGVCPTTDNATCSGSTNWETGWIVFPDDDGDGTADAGEDPLRNFSGPTNLTVRAGISSLSYRPNGRIFTYPNPANNTPGEFVFCDSRGADQARVVNVNIDGRPQSSATKLGGIAPSCP